MPRSFLYLRRRLIQLLRIALFWAGPDDEDFRDWGPLTRPRSGTLVATPPAKPATLRISARSTP